MAATSTARQSKPIAPLLTHAVARRLVGWSQARVAVCAGVGIATVRIFELNEMAVADSRKRRALAEVYADLRLRVMTPPK